MEETVNLLRSRVFVRRGVCVLLFSHSLSLPPSFYIKKINTSESPTHAHRQTLLSSDCNRNVYISHVCWCVFFSLLIHFLIEFNYCTRASFIFTFVCWNSQYSINISHFVMYTDFLSMQSIWFIYCFFIYFFKTKRKNEEEARNEIVRKQLLLEFLGFGITVHNLHDVWVCVQSTFTCLTFRILSIFNGIVTANRTFHMEGTSKRNHIQIYIKKRKVHTHTIEW